MKFVDHTIVLLILFLATGLCAQEIAFNEEDYPIGMLPLETKFDSNLLDKDLQFGKDATITDVDFFDSPYGGISFRQIAHQGNRILATREINFQEPFILIETIYFNQGLPYEYHRRGGYLEQDKIKDTFVYQYLMDNINLIDYHCIKFKLSQKHPSILCTVYAIKDIPPPPEEIWIYGQETSEQIRGTASFPYELYDNMELSYLKAYLTINMLNISAYEFSFFPNEKQRILWEDYWNNYYSLNMPNSTKEKFHIAYPHVDSLIKNEAFEAAVYYINKFREDNCHPWKSICNPIYTKKLLKNLNYYRSMSDARTEDSLGQFDRSILVYLTYSNFSYSQSKVEARINQLYFGNQKKMFLKVLTQYFKEDYNAAITQIKKYIIKYPNDQLAKNILDRFDRKHSEQNEIQLFLKIANEFYKNDDYNISGGIYRMILERNPDHKLSSSRLIKIQKKYR